MIPEATYLIWIDCSDLGIGSKEFCEKILQEGRLRIIDGSTYGEAGAGFIRINIACFRYLMILGLERLEHVLKS